MGIAVAAGVPVYDNYGFQAWLSGEVQNQYRRKSVIPAITTTDHTAKLAGSGNTVNITTTPKVTSHPYVKGATNPVDQVEPGTIQLVIDKAQYWGFPIYEVDERQFMIKSFWKNLASEAGKDQSEYIEQAFFADIVDDAAAEMMGTDAGADGGYNLGSAASPVAVTSTNVDSVLLTAGTILDQYDAPPDGRYLIIPPAIRLLLLKSDYGKAYLTGDRTSPLRNGEIGPLDRFTTHLSNRLPVSSVGGATTYACLYGQRASIIFYEQMNIPKVVQGTDPYSREMRGLQVYGYKAVRTHGFGVMYLSI